MAAANAMNGDGIRGVDWNAQIISRNTNDNFGGWLGDNVVAQKITNAVAEGANVLNCSWSWDNTFSTTLKMAFDHAYQMDRMIVATMGNTGITQKRYPGGYRNVMAVGATQNNDERSPFSTMGNHIDVVAPGGVNIVNTDGRNIFTTNIDSSYTFTSGTSFAAPQVAGLASLLKGYRSNLTNDDIRQIIRLSADKVQWMNGQPFTTEYGYGRINAGRALQMLQAPNEFQHGVSFGGTTTKTNLSKWIYMGSKWGLAAGIYLNVDRYLVTKRVNFAVPFCMPPSVWMRERQSACLSAANPNDGFPWAQITNVTTTGFDVTYYTYYVRFNSAGQTINKWVPANLSTSNIAYTALGVPNLAATAGPISGPTLVCNTSATFTLNNLPAGYTVSWSHAPGLLTYVSGQGTANYTVQASSSSVQGSGWVEATIAGTCGNIVLRKDLWAGRPLLHGISGPQHVSSAYFTVNYEALPFNYNTLSLPAFTWWVTPAYHTLYPGNSSALISFPNDGDYIVHLSAQNSCGLSGPVDLFVAVGIYEPWMISPNPAYDYFNVSILDVDNAVNLKKEMPVKRLDLSAEATYTIRVFNSIGILVFSTQTTSKHITIPVSHLKRGHYIVELSDGKNSFRKRLLIAGR